MTAARFRGGVSFLQNKTRPVGGRNAVGGAGNGMKKGGLFPEDFFKFRFQFFAFNVRGDNRAVGSNENDGRDA